MKHSLRSSPLLQYAYTILFKENKWKLKGEFVNSTTEEQGERGCYIVLKRGIQSQNKTKMAARSYGILVETLGSVSKLYEFGTFPHPPSEMVV